MQYNLYQGSKSLARIVWIDQSQYEFEYHITHSSIVIGQFKQSEPTISNPDLYCKNQSSKFLARIIWINQSQYENV